MNINIVTVSSGWILQKIAERTAKNCPPNHTMSVSHTASPTSDANYYADIQNCYSGQKTNCDVGYFTHADENSKQWVINLFNGNNAWKLNGIVSMNKRYTDMLVELGYPSNRITTITPGQTYDTFPMKKIKIGVVSRGGYPGYGQFFMENFFSTYTFENIEFLFLGNGWDGLLRKNRNNAIKLFTDRDVPYSDYVKFYHNLDYLLIPGLWTAGPMAMQEALSCGLPIISADVGFTNYEFKADYVFAPNDIAGLNNIICQIESVRNARRKQVSHMTWANYARDVVNFIERVKKI